MDSLARIAVFARDLIPHIPTDVDRSTYEGRLLDLIESAAIDLVNYYSEGPSTSCVKDSLTYGVPSAPGKDWGE